MADELIDIFDEDLNHLGTAMKSQAHAEGLWHKVFHCWIVKEKANPVIWLQLRGKDKELYPNFLDISSAGHIQAGEDAKEGGVREIEEELGLKVDAAKLNKLFTHKLAQNTSNQKNREFCATYLFESKNELTDLIMQPEEVDGVFEAKISDLVKMLDNQDESIEISGYIRGDDVYLPEVRKVTFKDFAPHGKEYYTKIFNIAARYFEK